MKKVFCKNCKFNGFIECKYFQDKTNPFNNERKDLTHQEWIRKYKGLNKDGECQYYRRKWWKFWVN